MDLIQLIQLIASSAPHQMAMLIMHQQLCNMARPNQKSLKNIPNWQGNTPTPHQLIMMAGGTIGGKEALDLVPPGDLGTLLERTVVHQLEAKKRHDRNYGERAKQLLEDLSRRACAVH